MAGACAQGRVAGIDNSGAPWFAKKPSAQVSRPRRSRFRAAPRRNDDENASPAQRRDERLNASCRLLPRRDAGIQGSAKSGRQAGRQMR
jgi:hypothetical protein